MATLVRVLALALVAVAFQAVMVTANVWPSSRTAPRDVPIVVAGPEATADALARRLEARSPGAFQVERLPAEQDARQAVADRRAYGAFVVEPDGPHLIIASGAAPAVAQSLTDLERQLSTRQPSGRESSVREPSTRESPGRQPPAREPSGREPPAREPFTRPPSGRQVSGHPVAARPRAGRQAAAPPVAAPPVAAPPVVAPEDVAPEDVAPSARHDPRGTGGAALVLALILSGIGGAALLSLRVRSAGWRTAGLFVFAAGSGLTSALIIDTWLSVLPGSYPAVAGTIALATLAVAASVTGLAAAIPRAGLGLGAAVMMLLANPWSGAASAAEMLPRPWGTAGQDLPAGATATLLRSATFFGGAGAGTPLTVLLIWTSYGLILLAAGTRRHQPPPAAVSNPLPGAVSNLPLEVVPNSLPGAVSNPPPAVVPNPSPGAVPNPPPAVAPKPSPRHAGHHHEPPTTLPTTPYDPAR